MKKPIKLLTFLVTIVSVLSIFAVVLFEAKNVASAQLSHTSPSLGAGDGFEQCEENEATGFSLRAEAAIAALQDNTGKNALTQYTDLESYDLLSADYVAQIIYSSGDSSYFTADEFASAFASAPDGSTVRLCSDVTVSETLLFEGGSKTTTLDLNGYKLYRLGANYTDYEAVFNEETGEYEKGEELESPARISGGYLFNVSTSRNIFNLKSSRSGGEIYNITVTADRLLLDGAVVASEVTKTVSNGLFSVSGAYTTLNILGENLTTYSNSVIYAEHGGGANTCSYNVDGGTYVKIVSSTTAMFHILMGGTHSFRNATFVANGSYFMRATTYAQGSNTTIENCDVINGHISYGESANASANVYTVTNSRMDVYVTASYGTLNLGSGVRFSRNVTAGTLADGYERSADTKTVSYSVANSISIDPTTLLPVGNSSEMSVTYTYLVNNPETDWASVTWKDCDGSVIKTESLLKGELADAPLCVAPSADGWISAKVTSWLDSEGNVASLVITDDDEQVYTALTPTVDESTEYVANITDARLSFAYYCQFHMYFYLPVTEGMDRPTVTGKTPSSSSGKALIDGREYWLYTWWTSAAGAADDYNINVNFEIDGAQYTQSFTISALVYAEIVLEKSASDEEAYSVGNMIRYIKEARKLAGYDVGEKFDKLIGSDDGTTEGLVALSAYAESYPDDSLDVSAISDYVDSFALAVSGGTPRYKFVLSRKALDLGITVSSVTIKSSDGVKLGIFDYAKDGKTYETNNVKIYDLIDTITISIKVPAVTDSETGEVTAEAFTAIADYSIGTYIKGVEAQGDNAELAKAAYAFGLAAEAYRKSVINY